MTTARDIMHQGAQCIGVHETLERAAAIMREQGVGALPVCGDDDRLQGIITDRDIVISCVAAGHDPHTITAGDLVNGTIFTAEADADVDTVLHTMEEHQIRRLPITENHRLVGMISEADVARHLTEDQVAHFVNAICASSPVSTL